MRVRLLSSLFLLALSACATTPQPEPQREIASTKRVLLIGDSHTTGYLSTKKTTNSPGIRLSELLAENSGIELSTYGSCGSQTETWVRGLATSCGYFEKTPSGHVSVPYPKKHSTPKIDNLLAQHKPELVIVALGANFLGGYPESWIKQKAAAFVKKIRDSGAKCAWVGPPALRTYGSLSSEKARALIKKVDRALADAVDAECPYVSTLGFVSYPATGGDGLHYSQLGERGRSLADTWAKKTLEGLKREIIELR